MRDRNVFKSSVGHDFQRLFFRLLLKSATLLILVFLVVVSSFWAYGIRTSKPASNLCRAPKAVVDDFSGPAGAAPDPQLWSLQSGAGGSDGQLEAYTKSPRNASLDGNGNLAIVARKESFSFPGFGTFNYTSAFLSTSGHLDVCYGTVAARIKLPTGKGLRPAFWLLGSDFAAVGWPQCGEIDVLDVAGVGGVGIHGAGGYGFFAPLPFAMGAEWHEYALDWRPDKITMSMDGHKFAYWTPESLPAGATWTFNGHPMYMVLNMAVGGPPTFVPDSSTQFPATMLVNWVRYTPAA